MYRPQRAAEKSVEIELSKNRRERQAADPLSIERGVRQMLNEKTSGNMVGLWLLIPEHLRLGTWDLLGAWSQQPGNSLDPRLALQLVHEAALCRTGLRQDRCLTQKSFALLNGLPFLASDQAVHQLLARHTVEQAAQLQINLGCLRRARQHFQGRILAVDPHRMRSYSQRHLRRMPLEEKSKPCKAAQTFFCLDADTHQPVCFYTASTAVSVAQATPHLLHMAGTILNPAPHQPRPLVLADTEHYTAQLFDHVTGHTPFDLIAPLPDYKKMKQEFRKIPKENFCSHWAGLATAAQPYALHNSHAGPYHMIIQRTGEAPDDFHFKPFLATRTRRDLEDLTVHYPKRWHIEEFFNAHQDLGWKRAGTLNLNIRHAQMTFALIAQAALHQLRTRLELPFSTWDAGHLAHDLLMGLDGDVRILDDTILVTFYNAPPSPKWRTQYEHLPQKLAHEQINPRIPWLYDYKLDFRFR